MLLDQDAAEYPLNRASLLSKRRSLVGTDLPMILLVDDEIEVCRATRLVLRNFPLRILTATTPQRAWELLDEVPIDIAVCDELMPKMLGSRLLGLVREFYPGIGRVLLTGNQERKSVQSAFEEGIAQEVLAKPCSSARLVEALTRLAFPS
jgi:CheY-like chemotaxis protein